MRILHVVPTYVPAYRYGGPIESVHALNKHLVREGAEVTVFTTAIDGAENLQVPLGVPVDRDGVSVRYFPASFPRAWFNSRAMKKALEESVKKFDIVHITSVFLAASTLGARAAARAEKPYLISPRGSLMHAPLTQKSALKKRMYLAAIEKRNLRNASAIHFTTDLEREEYDALGLPRRGSFVIPNGLDTSSLPEGNGEAFRKRFNIKPDEKIVLFLSRLSWKKGLDTLVDAFAGLVKEIPKAVLVVVGGDDEHYRSEVEAHVVGRGITDRTVFTGELRGADKSSAYEAADVLCLPSYAENFGGVVAEAMHFKVPVVITEEVGIAPWIKEHEAGFVVKKDELQVKFALYKILSNLALARKMGESGAKLVRDEFSYGAVAKQFLEAYSKMIRSYRHA